MTRVIFVCHANVARSPYAEQRARALAGPIEVEFLSAGVLAESGQPMDRKLAKELRSRGVEPEPHASRPISEALLATCDVVLTMEFSQHMRIHELFPEYSARVFGLRQFAEGRDHDSMAWDIQDPFGRGRHAARRCAVDIDAALQGVILRLPPLQLGTGSSPS